MTTSPAEPRTLTEMQRYGTSYEIGLIAGGYETRLGFTGRPTKATLLKVAQHNADQVLALIGDWDGKATYSKAKGWTFGPARVYYTGRTERDVANAMGLIV